MSALEETIALLAEMTAHPTVSDRGNRDLVDLLAVRLRADGARVRVLPDQGGDKANLLASFGPEADGGLLLSGHLDVVPPGGGWTSEAFDPEVRGEEVAAGLIGRRPVGAIERHSIVNADYRFGDSGFSLDGTIEETGNRIANASNTLVVPPRTGVSVGGRYRFVAHKVPFLLRVQTANVFNTYGYGVGSSGFFVYNGQRRLVMSLAVDL